MLSLYQAMLSTRDGVAMLIAGSRCCSEAADCAGATKLCPSDSRSHKWHSSKGVNIVKRDMTLPFPGEPSSDHTATSAAMYGGRQLGWQVVFTLGLPKDQHHFGVMVQPNTQQRNPQITVFTSATTTSRFTIYTAAIRFVLVFRPVLSK
jgi:hypothetical protein